MIKFERRIVRKDMEGPGLGVPSTSYKIQFRAIDGGADSDWQFFPFSFYTLLDAKEALGSMSKDDSADWQVVE